MRVLRNITRLALIYTSLVIMRHRACDPLYTSHGHSILREYQETITVYFENIKKLSQLCKTFPSSGHNLHKGFCIKSFSTLALRLRVDTCNHINLLYNYAIIFGDTRMCYFGMEIITWKSLVHWLY